MFNIQKKKIYIEKNYVYRSANRAEKLNRRAVDHLCVAEVIFNEYRVVFPGYRSSFIGQLISVIKK